MQKIILKVEGMTCSACSNGLEKYLNKQNGIESANVNLVMASVIITYDEKILSIPILEEKIKEAGFHSLGIWKEEKNEKKQNFAKKQWIIYTILIIICFYLTMGHMIGLPMFSIFDPHQNPNLYVVVLVLLTGCFLFYGKDLLKSGWSNLIHKTPNMDTLVSIGIISSILYSLYHTYHILIGDLTSLNHLYFESVCMMIYFIKLGRWIDKLSKDKTKEAIQELVQMTPKEATILKDGKEKNITIDEIQKGDIVISRPGEKIAVDGQIIKGYSHIDESFITGESKQVKKGIGDSVMAGSINYDGYLEYKAERIGAESTISEIVKLVMEATSTKVPMATLADKVSRYFVPIILLLATFTCIIYLCLDYSFGEALNTFVTLLVVACPCSLGLATPLAIVVAEGICAQNGILVKKSEILENASKINTVILDKTGTITYGSPKIETILLYEDIKEIELLQLVGSLEMKSTHPIGKAFIDYMKENKIDPVEVETFSEISGKGIIGKIGNSQLLIGNSKLLKTVQIEEKLEDSCLLKNAQNSIVYVVKDQKIIALIGINDRIRKDVKIVVDHMQKQKIEVIMLTGDHQETAQLVANQIGITHVIADVLPSEKASVIQSFQQEKKYVMMCGDGINDSPALATSFIGVSMCSGSDIAVNSADVILTHNDLYGILNLMTISKKTVKNVKQNLFWAFFYNLLMIPLAMGIFKSFGISMNPTFASIAMTLSSLTVVMNALRLRKAVKKLE